MRRAKAMLCLAVALKRADGRQRRAAVDLGVTERILGYKIKKYNIHPKYL